MKRQEYSTKEALERVKLMMNYDSRKTLTENKESILIESSQGANITVSAIFGLTCGITAGAFSFGWGAVPAGMACAALGSYLSDLSATAFRSNDIVLLTNSAITAGKTLTDTFNGKESPGFNAKLAARQFNDAVENESGWGKYLLGAGTDEELLRMSLESCKSVVDLYLLDKEYRRFNSSGIASVLRSELDSTETVEFYDMIQVVYDTNERAKKELDKKMKSEEKEDEKTGKSDARKEKYGCLSDIGKLFNANAVTIPSEDDGGYCMAFYNAGTQTFDSGRLLCYNNSKVKTGSGYWSCSGGKFSVRKYVVDSIEIKKGNLLSELKVGGVDLNKSFNNERTSNSGNGRVSPGTSKWKNCTDSYMKLCKEDDINGVLHKVQSCLGVKSDGLFGNRTETALFNKTGKKTFTTNDVNTICGLQQKQDDEYTIDRGNDAVDNTQGI